MVASLLFALAASTIDLSRCNFPQMTVDFIMNEGDSTVAAIEDEIRAELQMLNITVVKRAMPKDELNSNMTSGNFNMVISETWGPPYDPHSFAASWSARDEAHYPSMFGLPPPHDRDWFSTKITAVLSIENVVARQEVWTEILRASHAAAIDVPLYGVRIPAVINNRLSSYRNGLQQFDYPLHTLRVESGSTTITVSPGGQSGRFVGVGRLDAHSYRPNEFWANNMVYEGLVEYGAGGQILPSLALQWAVTDTPTGQRYLFTLRQGVTFHDGADWNCAAAKLNFDHVLVEPLKTAADYHGWYLLMKNIESWSCVSTFEFEVLTNTKYYPLLQELSYIRPLRMISPTSFVGGATSSPITQNSCPTTWEDVGMVGGQNVTCAGVTALAGTGKWRYVSTTNTSGAVEVQTGSTSPANVSQVTFSRFAGHWEGGAVRQVETVNFVMYEDAAAVKAALIDGTLDAVIGEGVLPPVDVREFQQTRQSSHNTYLTEPILNKILILNANRTPTNSLDARKVIIHGIDKAAIVEKEFDGVYQPVDTLFPKSAPYCNLDLTPRWDYDFEKARLIQCDPIPVPGLMAASTDDDLAPGWIALIVIASVIGAAAIAVTIWLVVREKQGKPVFAPIPEEDVAPGVTAKTSNPYPEGAEKPQED